jgi:tRNA (cmo5U34)-methyltransferase
LKLGGCDELGTKENEWLREDRSKVDTYLDISEIVLIERRRVIKILADLFTHHFRGRENLNLLDLGCGDAIVTRYIRDRSPRNNFHLLDGSSRMMEKARENLVGGKISFIHQTFEEYIASPPGDIVYDFVYSAFAVHHLDHEGKERLYDRIFLDLGREGLFLNIDVVKPPSDRVERLQFLMWSDWIEETLTNSGRSSEVEKFRKTPEMYKKKEENKPSELWHQLNLLTKAGFVDVDCHYKYGIFTIFGGVKP